MSNTWISLFIYTFIPALCMAVGGILAYIKTPSENTTSIVQHFAAGVVFAAVAIELLPKVVNQSNWLMSIGFICGVVIMLIVDQISHSIGESKTNQKKFPLGQIFAVAIDVFIDGILIGVSFLASKRSGIMIAAALTLEVFFLGISTAITMHKKAINKTLALSVLLVIAILIPCGAFLGYAVVSQLSFAAHMLILAFGVAALLYLVTEELLVEAHEVKETTLATTAFFAGFLAILLFA